MIVTENKTIMYILRLFY